MTALMEKLVFVGEDPFEQYRAQTLWTKEPGTIKWLRKNLLAGDVFYDIGANIGCYTLIAAQLVGETGSVFAFEPHVGNAHSLLRNVNANGFGGRVRVLTVAVAERQGFSQFAYGSLRLGSSGSQFGGRPGALAELKYGVTLDNLGGFPTPALLKIDVDGNELAILRGGRQFFAFDVWPRSVQVETPPSDATAIRALMSEYGYALDHVHYTANGQQQIDQGADPTSVVHNGVFVKQ